MSERKGLGLRLVVGGLSVLAMVAASLSPSVAQRTGGTEVSGAITEDTFWPASGSPYRVVGDLSIEEGATLLIEKTSVVVYERGIGSPLVVRGTLDAKGNARETVLFSCEAAVIGCWKGIEIYPSGEGGLRATLDHVEVEFAETGLLLHPGAEGYLSDSSLRFNHDAATVTPESQVDRNVVFLNAGVGVRNPGERFSRNLVTLNGLGVEILQEGYVSPPRIRDNSIYGNGPRGDRRDLRAFATEEGWTVDATENFWGTMDRGRVEARIIDSADEPDNNAIVDYDPFRSVEHVGVFPLPPRPNWVKVRSTLPTMTDFGERLRLTPTARNRTFRDCTATGAGARYVVAARPADGDGKKVSIGSARPGSVITADQTLKENSVVSVRLRHDILYCAAEVFARVDVRPKLSLDAPSRASGSFEVRGRVAPKHTKGVVIERRLGGRWERIARANFPQPGRFRAVLSAAGSEMVIRARFTGDRDHAMSTSPVRRVRT